MFISISGVRKRTAGEIGKKKEIKRRLNSFVG
jgi:hypothetical protein